MFFLVNVFFLGNISSMDVYAIACVHQHSYELARLPLAVCIFQSWLGNFTLIFIKYVYLSYSKTPSHATNLSTNFQRTQISEE